jgi:hypothetical protein
MRRLYPSHAAEANPVNSAKIPLKSHFPRDHVRRHHRTYVAKPQRFRLFSKLISGMAEGLIMTRFGAAAAIAIYWLFLICSPALAQSGKDLARKADDSIVCDGGSRVEGKCSCPAGFDLLPASANAAGSGTCVKTDAENCLGGQMTVAGTCFCSGRVTMSDESYTLELSAASAFPSDVPNIPISGTANASPATTRVLGSPAGPVTSPMKPIRARPRPVCIACRIRRSATLICNAETAHVRKSQPSPSIASRPHACAAIRMRIG